MNKKLPEPENAFASQTAKKRKYQPLTDTGKQIVSPEARLHLVPLLSTAITKAADYLLQLQNAKGYWSFDLEADSTIPSEYILLQRFLGREIAPSLQKQLAKYLRRRQLDNGGWPLFAGGNPDISVTVKAYFALKLMGDSPEAPHLVKARNLVMSMGGAAKVNVFTRITLALFGQIPWRTTPAMPTEIILLPRWFFFHLSKISYWSRTVVVPLLILYAKRPVCPLTPEQGVSELFVEPSHSLRHLDNLVSGNLRKNTFILFDRALKATEFLIPRATREKAIQRAEQWTVEHMHGEGGIGGIFPAMANALMALKVLGYSDDHPDVVRGVQAIDGLLIDKGDEAYYQPCLSPIWDSCLSLSALLEAGLPQTHDRVAAAVNWLFSKQILVRGDWSHRAPNLEPGGWAFQFENDYYPDVDDTAMVLMSLLRAGARNNEGYQGKIAKAVNWLIGMQSSDGGWGAFDIDNNCLYLNDIPYADHDALLDPSSADVTARCVELLSMLGYGRDFPAIARALAFLRKEQEDFGGWFGRWGVNYIYGTWSVLMALRQAGEDMSQPYIRKAAAWLKSCQNPDNGWGEVCFSYRDPSQAGKGESTPSQTAWALLALMAVGEADSASVQRGIQYLLSTQNDQGEWDEPFYTGTGFPNVFYLRYHGYRQYFPLWALGAYRRLRSGKRLLQDQVRLPLRTNPA